jgi:integrase
MKKEKANPIFAIAADNWKEQVMSLRKYGGYKSTARTVNELVDQFGHMRVQSITKEHIQKYIVKLSARIGMSQIKRLIGTFKGIMELADDDWEMPRRLKYPKAKKPYQPYYVFEDVRKMLQHSMGIEKVLIMLLAETGCRIGEAVALQTADIRPGKISITKNLYEGVLQDSPKTDSSIREVSISGKLEAELRKLCLSRPQDFVFRSGSDYRAYWPQQFSGRLKEICYNAGVEYKGSHAFRRGNITELLNDLEMPERIVGARVGHLSSGTTLGVYCKVKSDSDVVWVPKIEKWLYEGEK